MPYRGVKCIETVIDRKTNRPRRCKALALRYSCQCVTHARMNAIIIQSYWREFFEKRIQTSATLIQSQFRRFFVQKKINLFSTLPSELWDKVLWHIRYQHYIRKKLIPSYIKIVKSRRDIECNNAINDFNKAITFINFEEKIKILNDAIQCPFSFILE
jgi:hypothetical protein